MSKKTTESYPSGNPFLKAGDGHRWDRRLQSTLYESGTDEVTPAIEILVRTAVNANMGEESLISQLRKSFSAKGQPSGSASVLAPLVNAVVMAANNANADEASVVEKTRKAFKALKSTETKESYQDLAAQHFGRTADNAGRDRPNPFLQRLTEGDAGVVRDPFPGPKRPSVQDINNVLDAAIKRVGRDAVAKVLQSLVNGPVSAPAVTTESYSELTRGANPFTGTGRSVHLVESR